MFKITYIEKINNENAEVRLSPHMTCHDTFFLLVSFSLPILLPEISNIGNNEYKHILSRDPLLIPPSVC